MHQSRAKFIRGKSDCKILAIVLLLSTSIGSFCQQAQSSPAKTIDNGGLVKFSLFPFLYKQLQHGQNLWLDLHYENRFNSLRNSFNLTIDYMNYTFTQSLNGVVVSQVPDNIEVWVIPQWRHYFKSLPYTGYYIQVFPTYVYRDHPSYPRKGSYFGLGVGTGYQFRISSRLRCELNTRLSYQKGSIQTIDPVNWQPIVKTEGFYRLALELSIGSILRR